MGDIIVMSALVENYLLEVRWTVFALSLIGILWTSCGSWRAITKRDLSAEAGYNLANLGMFIAFAGFQSGYLLEGVAEEPHWRNVVNLLIAIMALALYSIVSFIRRIERHDKEGRKTWLTRFTTGQK